MGRALVDSKLERKPVPYSSPHNRYEATRTGLPSPGNEVARLPKGDIGRKTGMLRGGLTKVRPRAELVCRKRRFPANALVSTPVSFVPPHIGNGIVHPSGPGRFHPPRAFKPCGAPFHARPPW